MRVVITHNFTDHLGTFDRLVALGNSHAAHGVQNTAVNRFQSVTHVRNGTADVYTERILEIRSVHDLLDIHRNIA